MLKQENKYELMLILKASLSESERQVFKNNLQELLSQMGGAIKDENLWGKRLMKYPIKKEKEGYYVIYNILLPSNKSSEFSSALNINSSVLRYLLRKLKDFEDINAPKQVK